MASYYVYSGASGAGTGADWTNAYTTLTAAVSGKSAGDIFYVAHDYTETLGSALTITVPGTEAAPCQILCVSRSGSVPPVSADLRTTAVFATSGSNAVTFNGSISECYGITMSAGSGVSNASVVPNSTAGRVCKFTNCTFKCNSTGSASRITVGSSASGSMTIFENCNFQFANVGQSAQFQGRIHWKGGSVTGSTFPTTLFLPNSNTETLIEGVDLSNLGSGKTLCSGIGQPSKMVFKDCKLGASVAVSSNPTTSQGATDIIAIRCDSGDTNYRSERWTYAGTLTTETTIVRSGGASDGVTPIAWKIVTTANSKWGSPFDCFPITVWNETTGSSVTVTVQGIWGGGATPLNDEIWMDVEYLGTSGFPLGSFATTNRADFLATGTSLSAGSGSWGGSTTSFSMAVTITPQEKGPITVYVRATKPSTTFYIDPKVVLT